MTLARLLGRESVFELRTTLVAVEEPAPGVADLAGTEPALGLVLLLLSFNDAPMDSSTFKILSPLTRNAFPSSASHAGIDIRSYLSS